MNTLMTAIFIIALVGFITSLITLYKMVSKKKAQRLPN
jgi:hypothetical protein